jgi:hypothetical protein
VWISSQEENTNTRRFSSAMLVTLAREVLDHFRSQTKAQHHLRKSRQASSKKWAHIANIAKSPGNTLGSVPCHLILTLPYLRITHPCMEIIIFLLSKVKGKVKAKFIGKLDREAKKKLPKQLWVPKALVTHVQGPKLVWVRKTQN